MKKPDTLPKEIVAILLPRLQDEFNASYMYRAASNYCKGVGFEKAAEYFANESADELAHAKKIEDFLVDWNVEFSLPAITQTKPCKNLLEIIEMAYDVENKLYENYEEDSIKVFELGDICAFDLLQFFRGVQLKSVTEYSDMLNILEGVQPTKFNLLLLEDKLF
tara:strand:+ start:3916 stop:4407 length:492 start_codon:yes stop_codon:yes gene_type:complete